MSLHRAVNLPCVPRAFSSDLKIKTSSLVSSLSIRYVARMLVATLAYPSRPYLQRNHPDRVMTPWYQSISRICKLSKLHRCYSTLKTDYPTRPCQRKILCKSTKKLIPRSTRVMILHCWASAYSKIATMPYSIVMRLVSTICNSWKRKSSSCRTLGVGHMPRWVHKRAISSKMPAWLLSEASMGHPSSTLWMI